MNSKGPIHAAATHLRSLAKLLLLADHQFIMAWWQGAMPMLLASTAERAYLLMYKMPK